MDLIEILDEVLVVHIEESILAVVINSKEGVLLLTFVYMFPEGVIL